MHRSWVRWAFIVPFCLFHMTAVALYLLPADQVPERLEHAIHAVRTVTNPYILSLSQWQRWDIFAPDPLRKESTYRLEKRVRGQWVIAEDLSRDALPRAERAKTLKVLGRLEKDWKILVTSYLKAQCERLDVHSRDLRLVIASRTLPNDIGILKVLRHYPLTQSRTILGTVRCF